MNSFSEKIMEDEIVKDPDKFIDEKGLKLLARQHKVGSYVFDLLFEDRHGAKLIVEIQKGTLDRTHTYKILDYYHEYKEANPNDFIDVMVIANIIPPERKNRLSNLGVEYMEISESKFFEDHLSYLNTKSASSDNSVFSLIQNQNIGMDTNKREYFKSKNPSEFIQYTRGELIKVSNSNWKIGGISSLTAKHMPTINSIGKRFGKGLITQIWLERPKNGYARCKFEIANKIGTFSDIENKSLREKIASSLRLFMEKKLPKGIDIATGSTIIAIRIASSRTIGQTQDINIRFDENEINKILNFFRFLDSSLNEWNNMNFAKFIEI